MGTTWYGYDFTMVLVSSKYHSNLPLYEVENKNLYDESKPIIWEEYQVILIKQQSDISHERNIRFLINDSLSSFRYEDMEIYNNMPCQVYYYNHKREDENNGYWRIKKGYIEGEKINNEWIINYKIKFGGKNYDKFTMMNDGNNDSYN